jgi:nucleoside-diphosphate-sugar epimerase
MCFVALGKGKESIYNVGGISRIRISDLAKLICDLTGSELIYPLSDSHGLKGAPSDVWLDIRKITDLNKKINFIEIKEGVKRTINWQKEYLY